MVVTLTSTSHTLHKLSRGKVLAVVVLCVVMFNEWLSYIYMAAHWSVPTDDGGGGESVRVLLAADPQIISKLSDSEPRFPFNIVTVWDGNRFVSRGFQLAVWRTKPEVVVFLGDLLNDGSIASDEQFQSLLHEFHTLVPIPDYVKHTVYVAGDNDVGGEFPDRVTHHKLTRFHSSLNQSLTLQYRFLDFIQVRTDEFDERKSLPQQEGRVRILLSHVPLLPRTKKSVKERIIGHNPSIVFSGHEHASHHITGTKTEARAELFEVLEGRPGQWQFEVGAEALHEVTVPTCSYRMGKKVYGYGFALIRRSGLVQYTVLWLPSRFNQLWLYVALLILVFVNLVSSFLIRLASCSVGLVRKCSHCLSFTIPKYHRI